MSGDHDLWYVKTADGDVDRMTLDQLDEAFNAGRIDENVTVLPAGESNWVRLGTLLGIDQPATPSPMSFAPVPNSMRPVSIDLSDDDPEIAKLHKKSRKGVGFAVAAAVLLIPAGILGANRMHLGASLSSDSAPNVAAAAVQAPPPVTAAPPPPAPAPPPPPTTAATANASADGRLTDEQKAKLAAADKALDAKIKSKQKARAISGGGHHSTPKYKSQGFTSGGNKYDPLNSGI
jgi:hypothetical protein